MSGQRGYRWLVALAAGALVHVAPAPALASVATNEWQTFRTSFYDPCTAELVDLAWAYHRVVLVNGNGTERIHGVYQADGTGEATGARYVVSATSFDVVDAGTLVQSTYTLRLVSAGRAGNLVLTEDPTGGRTASVTCSG